MVWFININTSRGEAVFFEIIAFYNFMVYMVMIYNLLHVMISIFYLQIMEEDKTLADYGLTSSLARAQSPAEVGLAFALDGGVFEELEKTPYSSPPELPDVMKPGQEASTQETTTA